MTKPSLDAYRPATLLGPVLPFYLPLFLRHMEFPGVHNTHAIKAAVNPPCVGTTAEYYTHKEGMYVWWELVCRGFPWRWRHMNAILFIIFIFLSDPYHAKWTHVKSADRAGTGAGRTAMRAASVFHWSIIWTNFLCFYFPENWSPSLLKHNVMYIADMFFNSDLE